MTEFHPDRRRHQRAYVPAVASLLIQNACAAKCLVRNLSESGVLLLGAPVIAPGTPCEVVLQGPDVGLLRLRGDTVRSKATEGENGLAVQFTGVDPEIADRLRAVVARALEERHSPSVLVVDAEVPTLVELAEGLGTLGHRTLLAMTPLEAVRWLCDLETTVDTVLVSDGQSDTGADLLAFIGEEFPAIHRVLVHAALPASDMLAAIGESNARAQLCRPFTLEALASALDVSNVSQRLPRASPKTHLRRTG